MDKKLNSEMQKMIGVISELSMCSTQKCGESRKKMIENKEIYKQYLQANLEIDIKKKEKLLKEVYKNKLVYDYNHCIFNNCKKMYHDLLKVLESFIGIIKFPKETKMEISKNVKKIKSLLNSKNINDDKINEILTLFIIIQSFLKSKS